MVMDVFWYSHGNARGYCCSGIRAFLSCSLLIFNTSRWENHAFACALHPSFLLLRFLGLGL